MMGAAYVSRALLSVIEIIEIKVCAQNPEAAGSNSYLATVCLVVTI